MDEQTIIDAIRRWISSMVIGLNLCPFAERVFQGREARIAGMHPLGRLRELHLIADQHDIARAHPCRDHVRHRHLTGVPYRCLYRPDDRAIPLSPGPSGRAGSQLRLHYVNEDGVGNQGQVRGGSGRTKRPKA